jgi:hypothetical protein
VPIMRRRLLDARRPPTISKSKRFSPRQYMRDGRIFATKMLRYINIRRVNQ